MAQQASQAELNRFVKVVDEFKAKYARLIAPATKAQVYASGNQKMIADYETAVVRGNALNRSIAALVGAWAAFKRGYKAVTDTSSMYIGDAIDEIRSWFGYDPAPGIGEYGGPVVGGQKPYDMDKHLYGMSYDPMLNESGVTEQYDDVSRYASLGALAAAPALAAIPAAVAVAGVISAALILNSLMDKLFVSIEANRIQEQNPNVSREDALERAKRGLPSLLPGGISLPMIAAGAVALWFVLGKK